MRGAREGFFRKLGKSFSFFEYEELCEKKMHESFVYFLKLMILSTLIMFIAAIPSFIGFSNSIDKVMDNFEYLELNINASSKGPVLLFPGDKHKEVIVHWESNATEIEKSKVLVGEDRIVRKTFFGSKYTNLSGYSDVLDHKEFYKKAAVILMLFLIPSMIVGAYIAFAIKFILMILVLSAVTYIITRIIRFEVEYKHCFSVAVYASTIGILVAMISFPYNIQIPFIRIEWIGYALTLVYFIVGMRYAGYFEERRDREKEMQKRKRYLEVKK